MPSGASDKVIPYPAISSTSLWRKLSEAAFSKFAEEARSIGLAVNESKKKLFLSTAKDTSIEVSVQIGSSINTDNDICLEIRRRITLANICYFGLSKQLSKKALSWRTKICL